MKLPEIYVLEKHKIKDAMKTIDCGGLGIALVVDKNKKMIGVVTDSDIRRAVMNGVNIEHEVRTITNTTPIKIKENYTPLDIDNLLLDINKKKFPVYGTLCIPVVNAKGEPKDLLFVSEKGYRGKLSDTTTVDVKKVDKVLVVGGAGYLGGVLCRQLLECGYRVRVLDNFMYGNDGIKDINDARFECIKGDIRDLRTVVKAIKDIGAVVHLAAIVGDPASALDPEETIEINYLSTILLAEVCKQSQINRFIFASTCSVYGASETGKTLNEASKLNPVSLYAEMKLKSEQGVLRLEDDNFSPTVLRMGTLFGLAPRMRFDLVINILCAKAMMEGRFSVFGGTQWRAFCHVQDAAQAYLTCLEAPIRDVKGEIFNVAPENATIIDIGKAVKKAAPDAELVVEKSKVDERDYCVSDEKIRNKVQYRSTKTIQQGIKEIVTAFSKEKKYQDYRSSKYYNHTYLNEKWQSEHANLYEE